MCISSMLYITDIASRLDQGIEYIYINQDLQFMIRSPDSILESFYVLKTGLVNDRVNW